MKNSHVIDAATVILQGIEVAHMIRKESLGYMTQLSLKTFGSFAGSRRPE